MAQRLSTSASALLALEEAELAEAVDSIGEDDEVEAMFACRTALQRVRGLVLLSKAPCESSSIEETIQSLVKVMSS